MTDLAAFAAGEQVPGVAEHLGACATCLRRVEIVRRAAQVHVPEWVVAHSAEEIDLLVDELLRVPSAQRPTAAGDERFIRAAVAQRFSELAVAEWERDLNVALDHSRVATAIAGFLSLRAGRAGEIEFETWKNRSTIHRERGETDAARASLRRAGEAIERCADRELKRAIVWFAEAAICASRDVWETDQALALLERCEPVFDGRDRARRRAARTLRGIIHLHRGDAATALAAFSVVADETEVADRAAWADAMRNVANALIRVGRVPEAERVLQDVRAADMELGRVLQVVRDDALAAVVSDVRGEFDTAATAYADVRDRFAAAGENEYALIAGKDLAVALVAGDRILEACNVLRQLLTTSLAGRNDRSRFTAEALAYLRDLADRDHLTLDVAATVSVYIDRIHVQRAVPFAPPMSPLTM